MTRPILAALLRSRGTTPFGARPWLEASLTELCPAFFAGEPRGWGVAGIVGSETFIQSRPSMRGPGLAFFDDLLRTPAPTTVATCGAASPEDPRVPPLSLTRFRRWVAAVAPAGVPDEFVPLAGDLPDFLARARNESGSRDPFLHSVLATLHRQGVLAPAGYVEPQVLGAAVAASWHAAGAACDAVVSDGRTLVVAVGGGTLLALRPPPAPDERRALLGPPRSALYLVTPGDPPAAPVAGAERLPAGITIATTEAPATVVRLREPS